MRELSKTDPQKAMAMQQQAMKKNMEYMKSSFKSMIYTFIPIIIIFGWLNAHMAYYPIEPNQTFEVSTSFADGHAPTVSIASIPELEVIGNSTQQITDNKAVWELKGEAGEYKLTINYNNEEYEKELLISSERKYKQPEERISDSKLKKIVVGNKKIYPLGDISLLGWKPNW
ncbi:TMCO1/EMC3 family protein, partial [Candidatus Woesearchaeota archaeon]|nr:TMCO1/EMC3 family protein [Candidatus Woesearchaeota archaeon]